MKQVISQRIINLYQQKKGLNVGLDQNGLGSTNFFILVNIKIRKSRTSNCFFE